MCIFKVVQKLDITERTVPYHVLKIVSLVSVISNLEHVGVVLRDLRVKNAIKVRKRTMFGIIFLIVWDF